MKALTSESFALVLLLIVAPMTYLHASDASNNVNVDYITAPSSLSVEDELELQRTIASLNHALDAADYALYGSFFADDGVFTSGFGDATGPDGVAAALEKSRPFITNKRHMAGNLIITGTPEQAVVTSYLIVFVRTEALAYVGSAINVDTFDRRDGAWKVVLHDSTLDPATAQAMKAMMSDE